MEKCEKCGTMNKYHDKSGQVYHYISVLPKVLK